MGKLFRADTPSGSVFLLLLSWTSIGYGLHESKASIMNNDGTSKGSGSSQSMDKNVVNYYFEHMISEKDAASAFKTMADELINSECAYCKIEAHLLRSFIYVWALYFRRGNTGLVSGMHEDRRSVLFGPSNAAGSLLLRCGTCTR